jgi:hypothetical protein
MRNEILTATGAMAVLLLSQTVQANPILVSTINGCYDCHVYDTPSLEFSNPTAFPFTNVQLTLNAYQGLNNGDTQTQSIPDIPVGGNVYSWSGVAGHHQLFASDYDDEWGQESATFNPDCIVGQSLCSHVGNFDVTFTAIWNGQPIFSQFSPDNTQGPGNAAGTFVGWLGLDPSGLSETIYDQHSNGGPNGVLANIYVGTPPSSVPEPGTLSLLGIGGAALFRRLRKTR